MSDNDPASNKLMIRRFDSYMRLRESSGCVDSQVKC